MADIDLEGKETKQWIPIDNNSTTFSGTFEGNNHNINNLYINSTQNNQALFATNTGKIRNITVNGNINGNVEECFNLRNYRRLV